MLARATLVPKWGSEVSVGTIPGVVSAAPCLYIACQLSSWCMTDLKFYKQAKKLIYFSGTKNTANGLF